jgi:hypothetical protein
MPKDDTVQSPITNTQPLAGTPPPVLEDTVLPPNISNLPKQDIVNPYPTDTGSAAPEDDIKMQTQPIASTPRKKFAGGKVIATILGLFLLVGGLGAGIYLTGQNQDIREKACDPGTSYYECYDGVAILDEKPNLRPGETETCGQRDGEEICVVYANGSTVGEYRVTGGGGGDNECRNESEDCPPGTVITTQVSRKSCRGGWGGEWCSVPGTAQRITDCCAGAHYGDEDDPDKMTGCDNPEISTYVCAPLPTTPPVITPSPAPITASCQNVKAYTESWVLMTSAQLSALKPTNKVNFCVAGVATGGSFDKAKFMINNVEQAETTTKRPSSEDFCQLYNIPTGVNSFNVVAQIHHVTLGWK